MSQEEYDEYLKEQAEKMKRENADMPVAKVSLYEMNQGIVAGLKTMTGKEVTKVAKEAMTDFLEHVAENFDMVDQPKYYMFLCNELNYYTLFSLAIPDVSKFFVEEFIDLIQSLGNIKAIEPDTNGALAVWVDWANKGECHCFYLFPYDKGVVEV